MIICNNCGRENEDEFKFCLGCGSGLSAPKKAEVKAEPKMIPCPHCGAQVPGGFKFCGACGGSLAETHLRESSVDRTVQSSGPQASAEPESSRQLGELTVIQPDGSEGARIPLKSTGIVLGRDSEFDVLANDVFLCPRHAEIRYEDGILKLRDLDSINGVFWRLRDDVELEDGDLIRVGQELLRFQDFSGVEPVLDYVDGKDETAKLQGSPDPGVWARLALLGGPDIETRAFALAGNEATIGREIGSILFREDGFVSGKHARIYRDNGKVFLRDLGSSNGSYVRIRKERRLRSGDLVLMGQQLFRVNIG